MIFQKTYSPAVIQLKPEKNKLLKTLQNACAFKHAAHTTLFLLKLTFFSRSDGN